MDIQEINFVQIDKRLLKGKNIIYGAGAHGKLLYDKLRSRGVHILGFYDDYKSVRGGYTSEKNFIHSLKLSAWIKTQIL